ncbi:MAG TPA: hypothetical protein GX507_04245 [Clostridia bacterium]|nr:hypothetical protein [Clostridia bacterium]
MKPRSLDEALDALRSVAGGDEGYYEESGDHGTLKEADSGPSLEAKAGSGRVKVFIHAGGTDLLVKMRQVPRTFSAVHAWSKGDKDSCERIAVIDISGLRDLRGIRIRDGKIIIGALTTHAEIESSEIVRRHAPVLAAAASEIGSPQIRNRGTIGGNVCNASPAADLLPALVVYDAMLRLVRSTGSGVIEERVVPLDGFVRAPFTTVISPGEILTSVEVPVRGAFLGLYHAATLGITVAKSRFDDMDTNPAATGEPFWLAGYGKLGRRNALSISIASVALLLRIVPIAGRTYATGTPVPVGATGGPNRFRIDEARISIGAVTPRPIRFSKTEEILSGLVFGFDEDGQLDQAEVSGRIVVASRAAVDEMISMSGIRQSTPYKSVAVRGLFEQVLIGTLRLAANSWRK